MTCRHHISMILMFKRSTAEVNELNSTWRWYILEVGTIFCRSQQELHSNSGKVTSVVKTFHVAERGEIRKQSRSRRYAISKTKNMLCYTFSVLNSCFYFLTNQLDGTIGKFYKTYKCSSYENIEKKKEEQKWTCLISCFRVKNKKNRQSREYVTSKYIKIKFHKH